MTATIVLLLSNYVSIPHWPIAVIFVLELLLFMSLVLLLGLMICLKLFDFLLSANVKNLHTNLLAHDLGSPPLRGN